MRIVRLALEEKEVKYDLVGVDVFAKTGVPKEHLTRHPFGRIPAIEHGDFRLYETGAIVRYIDDAFPGCNLQPTDPKSSRQGESDRWHTGCLCIPNAGLGHLRWTRGFSSRRPLGRRAEDRRSATACRCMSIRIEPAV